MRDGKNQEDEKTDLCDPSSGACNTTKAEDSGDEGDYKEYDSVVEHI